jgi:VWFA-related protein
MKRTIIGILVLLLLAVMIPARANQEEENADRYEESLEVRIREVEVFVTDKKGNPVKGLGPDDFKLFENKIPLEILNFYAMDGGKRIDPGPGDPSLFDESSDTPAAAEQRPPLNLIVYVDNYNLHHFSRNRIFDSLKTFLAERVSGNDRVMVVSFDRGLNVRQPFTTDMELVRLALEETENLTTQRNYLDDERRDLLNEIAGYDPGSAFIESLVGRVETYASFVEQDTKYTLGALKFFVGALAGINGRKALLYVSDGLPMVAGEEMFYALEEKTDKAAAETGAGTGSRTKGMYLRSTSHDASKLFDDLTAFASSNRVTFYTVDAGGLRGGEGSLDVANRNSSFTTGIDTIARQNLQASLKYMAKQTGGLSFTNTNNFDRAMELVFADMDSFYSLGYKPIYSADNPYFKIKVKTKKRGLKTRYRRVSMHKGPGAEMAEGLRATLLFGQPDNAFGIKMAFGEPEKRGKDDYLVPTIVAVPMDSLFFNPATGYHECRVSLSIAARDERGWMSTVSEPPVPPAIQIPDESLDEARAGFFFYKMKLGMKAGDQTVAVGVRDEATAITSYTTTSVELAKDPEEEEE